MREILERLQNGKISVEQAEEEIRKLYVDEIGDEVRLDLERAERRGIPEVIMAEGKEPRVVAELAAEMASRTGSALVSRVMDDAHRGPLRELAKAFDVIEGDRCFTIRRRGFLPVRTGGKIGVLSGGTADAPIVEEVKMVAQEMGCDVLVAMDVGVAGLHRLFKPLKEMLDEGVQVLVVAAGMEGALPAVVASLVDLPVIGVPVSTGYGYGGKGEAALMSMLQACPMGIAVVNIDGGVAAGAFAAMIANKISKCGDQGGRLFRNSRKLWILFKRLISP